MSAPEASVPSLRVATEKIPALLDAVRFSEKDLVLAIAVDHATCEILMVAWMNRDTLAATLSTGVMTYWSRSRKAVWIKGETSGNRQLVQGVELDCDGDALRFRVYQEGRGLACHTGRRTCFYRSLQDGGWVETGDPPEG